MAKMSLHDLKTPLKALKYFYFYIEPFFLVIEVHISPNGPNKAHVHPPVDWYWTADPTKKFPKKRGGWPFSCFLITRNWLY